MILNFAVMKNMVSDPHHLRENKLLESGRVLSNFRTSISIMAVLAQLKRTNIYEIVGSIILGMVSRRSLYLGEFMEVLKAYGSKDLSINHPEACKTLFVKGSCEDFGANHLISGLQADSSNPETPERAVEEQVLNNFQDFFHWVEDEQVTVFKSGIVWDCDVEGSGEEDSAVDVEKYSMSDLSAAGVMQCLGCAFHMLGPVQWKYHFLFCTWQHMRN